MEEIKWLTYSLTHGFEELYHRKKGSIKIAWIIVFMLFIGNIVSDQLCDSRFHTPHDETFSIIPYIMKSIVAFIAWVIGNSIMSTLLDGVGTSRNTAIYSAYALVPFVAQQFINTALSHVLIMDGIYFMILFRYFGMIWTVLLMYFAIKSAYRYTLSTAVLSSVMTMVFMIIMLLLLVLSSSLLQQMWLFVSSVGAEIIYRVRS